MHNNIMAAGSKERPPMLGPGRYSQWHSRFLRYLDTKSNGEYLRKCILVDQPLLIQSRDNWNNVIPDSSNICTNDNQVDQNATECVDERAALANLIANLTLDNEENKTFLKQLKKANASLTQELKECKTNLDESSRALREATSSRDSSLIAFQTKQTELE
ncbi:hypothetical protein Tco_0050140, partial [Tanacetum coccineum]